MTGFFIKKAFFDGWDHLWGLVVLNLGFLALLGILTLIPLSLGLPGTAAWMILGLICYHAYSAVCAAVLRDAAEYRDIRFSAFRAALKAQGPAGLFYGVAQALPAGLFLLAAPFYLSGGTMLSWFAFGTLFWCFLALQLALQWFPAVRAFLPGSWKAAIRKCFLLMADNLAFSALLYLYSAAGLILSVLAAFLMPGPSGIALGRVVALKLILKKYDWLEANPDSPRGKIPWDELLEEERELVGKRTLKGMIFPWKE